MREIKFRGKRVDNGEWVEGFYDGCYETATVNYLKNGIPYNACVLPETVGQYTGLHDKNGKEIYEGDITRCIYGKEPKIISVVKFGEFLPNDLSKYYQSQGAHLYPMHGLYFEDLKTGEQYFMGKDVKVEVVGNIYDNPELLKESD